MARHVRHPVSSHVSRAFTAHPPRAPCARRQARLRRLRYLCHGQAAAVAEQTTSSYDADSCPKPKVQAQHPEQAANASHADDVYRSSLQLLEWPAVCKQLAHFCHTTLAAARCKAADIEVGTSLERCQILQQETREALAAALPLADIQDLSGVYARIRGMKQGSTKAPVHANELAAVGRTLQACLQVRSAGLQRASQSGEADSGSSLQGDEASAESSSAAATSSDSNMRDLRHPALAAHAAKVPTRLQDVLNVITSTVDVRSHVIRDSASPELQRVRSKYSENHAALSAEMRKWCELLYQKKASDRMRPHLERDRSCCAVKAGHNGHLPKGSVTLGKSSSGNTHYIEPATASELNNQEIALAEQQRKEEQRVIARACSHVAAALPDIEAALDAVVALDLAMARAGHSRWLGGIEPRLITAAEAQASSIAHLQGVRHPVLLQPVLDPLPSQPVPQSVWVPGRPAESAAEAYYAPAKGTKKRAGEAAQYRRDFLAGLGHGADGSEGDGERAQSAWDRAHAWSPDKPVGVDLRIPVATRVAAVTGPNTGGKTAALKTLGLSALMAQAGMYVHAEPGKGEEAPHIAVFEGVLADLGDSQSLEQSLSTFSGHVVRIRDILAAADASTLVLLDEVGSGTDPAEGAALAIALLREFSDKRRLAAHTAQLGSVQAAFTFTTTHHFEVKEEAQRNPAFVSAAVEFDIETLQPTYRLVWDAVGMSNALAVASTLGFDGAIVERGRGWVDAMGGLQQGPERARKMSMALDEQLSAAEEEHAALQASLQQLQDAQAAAEQGLADAEARKADAEQRQAQAEQDARAEARDLKALGPKVRQGEVTVREALKTVNAVVHDLGGRDRVDTMLQQLEFGPLSEREWRATQQEFETWTPAKGEEVLMTSGIKVTVVDPPESAKRGATLLVDVGGLAAKVKLRDLRRLEGSDEGGGSTAAAS